MARDELSLGDVSLRCAWELVDELARWGVEHACVSPGSRSTPLALALDRHQSIQVHVHLDERSSAFFALGLAKASEGPVAVACTSGTAAAELFPAVVEASQARVPLVVLTADRPPRLRGTGANQTIDQQELYGGYARAYLEPPPPTLGADVRAEWRAAGEVAARSARYGPEPNGVIHPGPVHVNCCFDEPLTPSGDVELRPTHERVLHAETLDLVLSTEILDTVSGVERGLVVAGAMHRVAPAIIEVAGRLGWPVLAEPLSHLRRPGTLAAGQALSADPGWRGRFAPDILLQVGATPTTRATQAIIGSARSLVVVADGSLDPDPDGRAVITSSLGATRVAQDLLSALPDPPTESSPWFTAWREADSSARRAIHDLLDSWDEPFEGRVARDLAAWIPDGGTLVAGSSMPIRDLDHFMGPREGLLVLANRGASGIDGFVSTTLGVAATDAPTFALCGDLTFLYDVGALLWNARRGINAVFVVVNNGGGAIFDFLPQRDLPEHDRLFTTPHGVDIGAVCAAAGVGHVRVDRAAELRPALDSAARAVGIQVIEVSSDRATNVARHEQVAAAVAIAISGI